MYLYLHTEQRLEAVFLSSFPSLFFQSCEKSIKRLFSVLVFFFKKNKQYRVGNGIWVRNVDGV